MLSQVPARRILLWIRHSIRLSERTESPCNLRYQGGLTGFCRNNHRPYLHHNPSISNTIINESTTHSDRDWRRRPVLSQPVARRIHLMDSPFRSTQRTDGEPLQSLVSRRTYGILQEQPLALPAPKPFNFYNLFQ